MTPLSALWITSNYPNTADPVAGIFFQTQARALVRAGLRVEVIAPVPFVPPVLARLADRWDRYRRTPRQQVDEGVIVRRPRYPATPRQNKVGIAHGFLRRAAERDIVDRGCDVIHGHYVYPEGIAALDLARSWGLPLVLTLHGDDGNTYPDSGPRARRRFERLIAGADHVLAVSDALADGTERRTGRRPEVLPIGLDLRPFATLPTQEQARNELGIEQGAFVVLFVGYLLDTKGVRELIAAMQAPGLADATTWFVGDGPLMSAVQLASSSHWTGLVPNERVRLFLRAADVLALPSYGEGTPTVVVEAGAAGLPVVATAVGGTVTLLSHGRGTLIPPRSVDALAQALLSVRTNRAAALERAQRLVAFVAEHHNADRSACRLRDIYLSLRDSRHPVAVPTCDVSS